MVTARQHRVSYAEYLAAERVSEAKHQWVNGEVFDMAGGTPEHARLQAAVAGELRSALLGSRCAVFSSDLRVKPKTSDLATYPDVTVVCVKLETHPEDGDAVTNPVVICEVLSPTTEAFDRGDKFIHYRRIPTLTEYVLVSQSAQRIEVFRRDGERWVLTEYGKGTRIELSAVRAVLDLDALYVNPLA